MGNCIQPSSKGQEYILSSTKDKKASKVVENGLKTFKKKDLHRISTIGCLNKRSLARNETAQHKLEIVDARKLVLRGNQPKETIEHVSRILTLRFWQKVKKHYLKCEKVEEIRIKRLVIEVGRHLSQIDRLDLDLSICMDISDKSVTTMILEVSRHLVGLRELKINFTCCMLITDKVLKAIGSNIARHLNHLEYLSLNFNRCDSITSKGLKGLSKYLTHLKRLELDFSLCNKITGEGLIVFGNELGRHMARLQHLNVRFEGCRKITDEAIENLGSRIGLHLTQLQILLLDFSSCYLVTGKGIKALGLGVGKNLTQLQELVFIFNNFTQIKESPIRKRLPRLLKSDIPMLETVVLEDKLDYYSLPIEEIGEMEMIDKYAKLKETNECSPFKEMYERLA